MKKSLLIMAAVAGTVVVNAANLSWTSAGNAGTPGRLPDGSIITTDSLIAILIWDVNKTGLSATTPYRDPEEIAVGNGSGLYSLGVGNVILDVTKQIAGSGTNGRVNSGNRDVTWGANTYSYNDPVTGNPVFPTMPSFGLTPPDREYYYMIVYDNADITLATHYQVLSLGPIDRPGTAPNAMPLTFGNLSQGGWQAITIIPEPTAMALLALGAAAVGLRRRFRK